MDDNHDLGEGEDVSIPSLTGQTASPGHLVPCPGCNKTFSSDGSLRTHLRRKHTLDRKMLPFTPRIQRKPRQTASMRDPSQSREAVPLYAGRNGVGRPASDSTHSSTPPPIQPDTPTGINSSPFPAGAKDTRIAGVLHENDYMCLEAALAAENSEAPSVPYAFAKKRSQSNPNILHNSTNNTQPARLTRPRDKQLQHRHSLPDVFSRSRSRESMTTSSKSSGKLPSRSPSNQPPLDPFVLGLDSSAGLIASPSRDEFLFQGCEEDASKVAPADSGKPTQNRAKHKENGDASFILEDANPRRHRDPRDQLHLLTSSQSGTNHNHNHNHNRTNGAYGVHDDHHDTLSSPGSPDTPLPGRAGMRFTFEQALNNVSSPLLADLVAFQSISTPMIDLDSGHGDVQSDSTGQPAWQPRPVWIQSAHGSTTAGSKLSTVRRQSPKHDLWAPAIEGIEWEIIGSLEDAATNVAAIQSKLTNSPEDRSFSRRLNAIVQKILDGPGPGSDGRPFWSASFEAVLMSCRAAAC